MPISAEQCHQPYTHIKAPESPLSLQTAPLQDMSRWKMDTLRSIQSTFSLEADAILPHS